MKNKPFYAVSKDEKSQMKLFKNNIYFLESFETVRLQASSDMSNAAF